MLHVLASCVDVMCNTLEAVSSLFCRCFEVRELVVCSAKLSIVVTQLCKLCDYQGHGNPFCGISRGKLYGFPSYAVRASRGLFGQLLRVII